MTSWDAITFLDIPSKRNEIQTSFLL